ncbi:S10 family peptidase [Rhizomicrobium palustre]
MLRRTSLGLLVLLAAAAPALGDAAPEAKDTGKTIITKDGADTPYLPGAKSIKQSATIAGKRIEYTATVGTILVKDDKGKITGEVVYTAYTVPGANRPVTFAFNGGPGAASVYLNLGAIGPKRIQFGDQGDTPSDPTVLKDNPASWLDFTDLVFIDPVGTGYSLSRVEDDKAKKLFFNADADISYLSRVVYDWLQQNGRMTSHKYLVGESYGGYRLPRLAYELQTKMGVGMNGITMVSPYLDPPAVSGADGLSPLPLMIDLPSMAAAKLEREGKPLNDAALAAAETYARAQFPVDFFAGAKNKEATDRLAAKVAEFTGLDPALVRRLNGRVDIGTYLRELRRAEGKIGSVYDSNVTAYDAYPEVAQSMGFHDPILESLLAPTTSAMSDFVIHQVGWKAEGHYEALSGAVNSAWDSKGLDEDKPVQDLRRAIAIDPKMAVTIVHGWNDLSCPYFASRLIIDSLPAYGKENRISLHLYPGGHMFYSRTDSGAQFRKDVMSTYK